MGKSSIPAIIEHLRAQPSLLDPGAEPVPFEVVRRGELEYIQAFCNAVVKDCAVAGSISFVDQGATRYAFIFEIKDNSGRKYLLQYRHIPLNAGPEYYDSFLTVQADPFHLMFIARYPSVDLPTHPYGVYLTQQEGYQEALNTLSETGVISPELEETILPGLTNP